jgi:hypothetical protein
MLTFWYSYREILEIAIKTELYQKFNYKFSLFS